MAAAGISLYLLWLSLSGRTAAGCSAEAGCGSVLGSRWSQVLGVPVSLGAVAVYAAMLIASVWTHRKIGRWVLAAAAAAVLGAATWFIVLQAFVLGELCVYCMAAHALGLAAAAAVLLKHRRPAGVLTGLAAAMALAAAQVFYVPPVRPVGDVRIARITNLDPAQYPRLGEADAPVAIGYLYDANCPQCRALHLQLDAARRYYGEALVIAAMPAPFAAECNEHVSATRRGFESSCELARLTLAVHVADPAAFEAFDAYLFADVEAPPPAAARAKAAELVGEDVLEAALGSAEVEAMLARNVRLFELLGRAVPRLIVAERAYPPTADTASLLTLLETLTPLQSPAAE